MLFSYKPKDSKATLEVKSESETVWLNQYQMAELFDSSRVNITEHIGNIYNEKELKGSSTCRKYRQVQIEGNRKINRNIDYFNLDVIIFAWYRVKSLRGTQFRIWATNVFKQHLIQGYTINEKRLKEQSDKIIELQKTVGLLSQTAESLALTSDEAQGIMKIISDYTHALDVLDKYDYDN